MTAPAYAIDGVPVSRAQFYAAACDPARSVVVEACAGAGKTWMLVSRILRALLEGAEPQQILAITFTKKAAGEMRARLDEWLAEYASPGCSDEQRALQLQARGLSPAQAQLLAPALAGLHERVLLAGRSVEVQTFHAWFARLLRAAPLEELARLGLQPDVDLVEDPTEHSPEVYRRFHAAVACDPALRADFDQQVRTRGRANLRKWLDAAWARRVEIERADAAGTLEGSVPPAEAGDGRHPAEALKAPVWIATLSELAAGLARGGVRAQEASGRLAQALEEASPEACFALAWKALFTDKDEPRKQLGKVEAVPAVQQALERLAEQVRQHEAREEHLRMMRLTRVLLSQYAEYKRARGLADMADLECCALELLADGEIAGWVQERLDARLRHVLIDEFQDTSPLQWHALHAWLAGYAGAGGGASGQRPPGVFIVGDPKQSIYRFRGAEPRVFEMAREFVVQGLGGRLLACDHTRRNAPAVVHALNEVFGQAQRERHFAGFRPHTTEVEGGEGPGLFVLPRVPRPLREDKGTEPQEAWRDSLTVPRREPEEVLRAREARQVACAIRQLVADGLAPGDIHVLCRKRESLRLVADALAACHVPFAAAEDSELLQAPEARDLLALLDALVSPQHRLSLAHALKSPVFGASDDDFVTLVRAAQEHHGDWWRALQRIESASAPLLRARVLLSRWRDAADVLPPHDLLDMIVHEGGLHERFAAVVPAERRAAALAAIDGVLHQALTLDGARHATPYNFVRALKRRTLKLPAASQPGAVQLLTVHGAKGLEAQVVFVVDSDPERKPSECATLLVDWPVHSEHPLHCVFLYSESQCPPSLAPVLQAEIAARRREEMNGLYVAMTRARARLVFSATEPAKEGDGPSWWQRVQECAVPWSHEETRTAASASASALRPVVHVLPPLSRVRVSAEPTVAADAAASRLGEAVHRVLEWAAAPGAEVHDAWSDGLSALAAAAALEFGAPADEVARVAARIWASPECNRFFRGDAIAWAGNEVAVACEGEPLRIDRLVLMEEDHGPAWWVLDYKLQHTPEALPAYREQVRRYREAVQQLQPGERVRCAFITGQGGLVELD